ncbi:MAG TPA: hypothetical protein VGH72_08660, partial [Pseudonocardia sp.]
MADGWEAAGAEAAGSVATGWEDAGSAATGSKKAGSSARSIVALAAAARLGEAGHLTPVVGVLGGATVGVLGGATIGIASVGGSMSRRDSPRPPPASVLPDTVPPATAEAIAGVTTTWDVTGAAAVAVAGAVAGTGTARLTGANAT